MDMNRYDRQERVYQIGQAGQEKISQATIMIVGTGALGSYAAEQLVRAGVRSLILVDPDTVEITNLQRQAHFTEEDANQARLKAEALRDHLTKINSNCRITAIPAPLTPDIIDDYSFNLCLDCLDNYHARDLLNKLSLTAKFDYIFASCAGTYGNVMPISATTHPCLNCLFPNLNDLLENDCDLIGVNTALVPLVAGLQVSLALHYLIDKASLNFNELITVDNWSMAFMKFKVNKNPQCPSCSIPKQNYQDTEPLSGLHMLCGENAYYTVNEKAVSFTHLHELLTAKHVPLKTNRMFLHFKWQNRPVSIFKNGKIIMYNLPNSKAAQQQLRSLDQLMKEDVQ